MKLDNMILKYKKQIYLFFWLILLIFSFFFLSMGINSDILWRNEGQTYAMTNNSIKDIIRFCYTNYHPPLYFVMIKLFTLFFGNSILALRYFSLLGTMALICLSFGPIKRILGYQGSLIYILLIIILPIFSSVSQDARMYSWVCFFVTASVLYGYLIIIENKIFDCIKFCFFTIASSYIHYYALIAVTFLNIIIFIYLIIINNRKKLLYLIILDVILILLFMPWVESLFFQINLVTKRFWIPKINYDMIMQTLTYSFGRKFAGSINYAGMVLFLVILYYGIRISIVEKNKQSVLFYLSLAVYSLTFLFAFIFSKYFKSILYPRYIFTVIGMIVVIINYSLSRLKEIKTIAVALIFIIIITLPDIISTRTVRVNEPLKEAFIYAKLNVKDNDVFIHSDDQTMPTFLYYFPRNKHFLYLPYHSKGYMNYECFGDNLTLSYDVNRFIKEANTIWILCRNESFIPFTVYKSVVYNDKYKLIDNPEIFKNINSSITIDLFKYEKNNY